jgi:hypothetical protein
LGEIVTIFKDQSLDGLAQKGNVAQFVSFRPDSGILKQSYCRVAGFEANHMFASTDEAVKSLLSASSEKSVNVRSYVPDSPRSKEFVYGLKSVEDVLATLERLADNNLHLIVNETIDVNDGGVSGVIQGDVMEFAPDDTPRCVEKPGVASLPFSVGIDLLKVVYGFDPDLKPQPSARVEFSIHPRPRGYKRTNTIVWEFEESVPDTSKASLSWPNRFSKHIGDKAYGLLIAHLLGMRVPKTIVIGRRVAPFSFGEDTGYLAVWTRTCPTEPQPGLFTTTKGWVDPFKLLAAEDPDGSQIASVLCQSAVPAKFSGAAVVGAKGNLFIEGSEGEGDQFMLGQVAPKQLPANVSTAVNSVYESLKRVLGAIRFEWVWDGANTWVVQLHKGGTKTEIGVIVPGTAKHWIRFDVENGLEALRSVLSTMAADSGIIIVGEVGLTSHVADLLRKAKRPAKLESAPRQLHLSIA